jgi:hypothetical protein
LTPEASARSDPKETIATMHMIHGSSLLSKKLLAAFGLVLALAALTAASAQAALIVPHVMKPEEIRATPVAPQPSDPSTEPGPSLPAPSSSSPDQWGGDGQGASPSGDIASERPGMPYDDVGHNAAEQTDDWPEGSWVNLEYGLGLAKDNFDQLAAQLTFGLSQSPVAEFFALVAYGRWIGRTEARLSSDTAVRGVLGYSEVTGEPCGADFQTLNEDDNPSNGIGFC